jgi:hypothetical protein
MNKKNKTTLAIIITILIALLVVMFIVYRGQESLCDKDFAPGTEWSNGQDYLVYQENNKTIVKNSLIGLTLEVPEDWTAEIKNFGLDEWAVQMKSSDLEIDENQIVQQGGLLQLEIREQETEFRQTQTEIKIIEKESFKGVVQASGWISKIVETEGGYFLIEESPESENSKKYLSALVLLQDNMLMEIQGFFSTQKNINSAKFYQILDTLRINQS